MVFIEVLRYDQNWAKKTDFLAHVRRFFVYPLIHPMSYAPKFCQMKDLIKIHICGKFYHIAFADVKLKFLKVYGIPSQSIKWPLLRGGGGWALNPPNIVRSC